MLLMGGSLPTGGGVVVNWMIKYDFGEVGFGLVLDCGSGGESEFRDKSDPDGLNGVFEECVFTTFTTVLVFLVKK